MYVVCLLFKGMKLNFKKLILLLYGTILWSISCLPRPSTHELCSIRDVLLCKPTVKQSHNPKYFISTPHMRILPFGNLDQCGIHYLIIFLCLSYFINQSRACNQTEKIAQLISVLNHFTIDLHGYTTSDHNSSEWSMLLPIKCIRHDICHSRMILDGEVKVGQILQPAYLSLVQVHLGEYVSKTLMIRENHELLSI